jgi:hypothetical protein
MRIMGGKAGIKVGLNNEREPNANFTSSLDLLIPTGTEEISYWEKAQKCRASGLCE